MKPEVIKLSLSANVPCGFVDSEVKINANAKMVDFLGLNKDAPEMLTLLEKIHTEKSPDFPIMTDQNCYYPSPMNTVFSEEISIFRLAFIQEKQTSNKPFTKVHLMVSILC